MCVNLNYKGMFFMKIFKLIIVVLLAILTLYSGYLAWDYKAKIVQTKILLPFRKMERLQL